MRSLSVCDAGEIHPITPSNTAPTQPKQPTSVPAIVLQAVHKSPDVSPSKPLQSPENCPDRSPFPAEMSSASIKPMSVDAEVLTDDDLALARLGHKQQLRRRFNIWSMLALSLCLLATWEALSTTLIAALLSGGPVSVIYGFLLAWAGTLTQAASLAEISSIYPTAGGQYHWTACMAPQGGKKWLSYVVGWASCGGLIATTASAPFACALQIQGLIGLCNPDYEPKTWVVVVSFWGVLLLAGAVNIFGIKLLPAFNYLSCIPPLPFPPSFVVRKGTWRTAIYGSDDSYCRVFGFVY